MLWGGGVMRGGRAGPLATRCCWVWTILGVQPLAEAVSLGLQCTVPPSLLTSRGRAAVTPRHRKRAEQKGTPSLDRSPGRRCYEGRAAVGGVTTDSALDAVMGFMFISLGSKTALAPCEMALSWETHSGAKFDICDSLPNGSENSTGTQNRHGKSCQA